MTALRWFDMIRVINLPSRPDRRRDMQRELDQLGLGNDSRVCFVDGIVVDDPAPFRLIGERGVFLSHLSILREAAAAGSSVLILEDDVDFASAASEWRPPAGCDIAYGGYSAFDPADPATSDIVGAHCMGFSAKAARALVLYLERLLTLESPPPIDGAYVWFRREFPGYATSFADPVIAEQRPSRSDIAGSGLFDRIVVLRPLLNFGRTVKRSLARGTLSFGLREAILVSAVGIVVTALVAWSETH